jgi:hypothetical protein
MESVTIQSRSGRIRTGTERARARGGAPLACPDQLHEVKRLQDGLPHRAVAVQGVKDRYAIISADHGLAVQGERLRPDLGRRTGDRRLPARPVIAAAGEQADRGAVAAHDQPVPVMLDLVHPIGAGRRLGGTGRDAGVYEAIGANNEHVRQIAARHLRVEPSQCRGTAADGRSYKPRSGR